MSNSKDRADSTDPTAMTAMERIEFPEGGYAYIPGGAFPFSNGVVALPGYSLTRVRLHGTPALAEGLAFAADWLRSRRLPPSALAAFELRSPAALPRSAFAATNDTYTQLLRSHNFGSATAFPMARSNLAPKFNPPSRQSLFAFSYAAPVSPEAARVTTDFIVSGKPELSESPPMIVAEGDVSPAGLRTKAAYVLQDLRSRVHALGGRWQDITGSQLYTVHSLGPVMDLLCANDLMAAGMTLFPSYPPVTALEFEVDVRAVSVELSV
jgi:hypothetical protein